MNEVELNKEVRLTADMRQLCQRSPDMSQISSPVATSRSEKHEKTWNQFIIVLILQCQKSETTDDTRE